MVSEQSGESITAPAKESDENVSYSPEDCFELSANTLAEAEIEGERARTLREWAKYELRKNNKDKGMALWQNAKDIFEELGAHLEVERMQNPDNL